MSLDPETLMDYWPVLIGVARNRMPWAGMAVWEDIAGETVERALRTHDRYQEIWTVYGWLTVMAARIAIDYMRRKANTVNLPLDDVKRGTLDAGSERHVASLTVRDALERSTTADRALLVSVYRDGLTLHEIASGPYTVKSTLSRRHTRALVRVGRILEGVS